MSQALGDVSDDILAFVNWVLQLADTTASTGFLEAMRLCVQDMSMSRIYAKTRDIALAEGESSAAQADDYIKVITLTPTTAAESRWEHLLPLSAGFTGWQDLMESDSASGRPEYYTYDQAGNFCFWPVADGAYVIEEYYWAMHPITDGFDEDIKFLNVCLNALKYGTATFYAMALRRDDDSSRWGAMYEREKNRCQGLIKTNPSIVGR